MTKHRHLGTYSSVILVLALALSLNAQDENRLMFELYSSILSSRSEMMRAAIDER